MLVRTFLVSGFRQAREHFRTHASRPLAGYYSCSYPLKRHTRRFVASGHMRTGSMASLEALPPAPVLQRDLFKESLHLKALRIHKRDCQKYMKLLAG